MESSGQDVYATPETFTFVKAKFESPYVTFRPVEHFSNVPAGIGVGVHRPPALTAEEVALVNKYSTATYLAPRRSPVRSLHRLRQQGPFSGASYSPSTCRASA